MRAAEAGERRVVERVQRGHAERTELLVRQLRELRGVEGGEELRGQHPDDRDRDVLQVRAGEAVGGLDRVVGGDRGLPAVMQRAQQQELPLGHPRSEQLGHLGGLGSVEPWKVARERDELGTAVGGVDRVGRGCREHGMADRRLGAQPGLVPRLGRDLTAPGREVRPVPPPRAVGLPSLVPATGVDADLDVVRRAVGVHANAVGVGLDVRVLLRLVDHRRRSVRVRCPGQHPRDGVIAGAALERQRGARVEPAWTGLDRRCRHRCRWRSGGDGFVVLAAGHPRRVSARGTDQSSSAAQSAAGRKTP